MIFEVKVPQVGESISEVEMGEWKKVDGDVVEMDEELCVIESEKASMEIVAEHAGRLKIKAQTGDTLKIGDVLAEIDTDVKAEVQPEAQPAAKGGEVSKSQETVSDAKIFVTPVARVMLEEAGISPETVKGSGPNGKITKADAIQAIESSKDMVGDTLVAELVQEAVKEPVKESVGERKETRERMTMLRRTIASHLLSAKNDTAMLTTINEIDMTEIFKLRGDLKEEFLEKYGVKLGFMSLFVRAVCIALKNMPVINARIEGEEIVYHHYCDISIAVSSPRGLVVPVVRNAEGLGLHELEIEIKDLAVKARDGKLTIQEMTGGTFTITNGGVFGSLISTPIINAPQSAVLGMHTIQERPVAVDGRVEIRPMMYVALSYDHRIIDGSESVLFLVHVKKLLEEPNRMLLEL
ncbi:MAG: 2-oxoglutarate dehydrogenase complex dihydrolipoyllysine-residue succinyltransferase [bacterium]|nr:2-oxoglutarate dehydrogenase complex dihydrolipoyllysine-residue succinyltransferase [bacterium]